LRFAAQPCAAAVLIARARLADELLDRAIWGHEETAEMMREDGRSFAKRRRLDARLGLAMLARLDRMVETRARAPSASRGSFPHRALQSAARDPISGLSRHMHPVGRRDRETSGAPAYKRGAAPMTSPARTTVPAKTRSNGFFRKQRTPLARDDARRQGDISQLAYLTMGGRDPAIAFLNAEHPALGGRPLAIATASAEGYARVAGIIRAFAPSADAA
jgi:hypothetical protein